VRVVLDASVAFKWFIDDEDYIAESLAIYEALRLRSIEVCAPISTFAELGHALRGAFLEKPAGPDGLDLAWERTRTSNTLVDGVWFFEYGYRFDVRFGRSGGEDTDLFRRIAAAGGRFRAAPDSAVREIAHDAQCRLRWILRRAWRGGGNYERLVAGERGRMAPLARFLKRIGVGLPMAFAALPAAIRGRPEHLFGALQGLALAAGGLVGWMFPKFLENARGYRSAGTLDESKSPATTLASPADGGAR